MSFRLSSSSRSVTVTEHHDRALTLVFGPDGQVSLIGLDGGVISQPSRTSTASSTGARSVLSEPSTVSLLPHLDVTTTSLPGASSSIAIPTSTFIPPSGYGPAAKAAHTDTNIPSISTVNSPSPTPTTVSNSENHSVGASFYLAIVFAAIAFLGCVSAFIAWWIRSRSRKRDPELVNPWPHRSPICGAGSLSTDTVYESEKGPQTLVAAQTRPYYLPASIVRGRSSSISLLAVPHTILAPDDGTPRNGLALAALGVGPRVSRPTNDPRSQNFESNASVAPSRPDVERSQSEPSVRENTCTLGKLRVTNRMPGDITSGDEGGMNMPRLQQAGALAPDVSNSNVDATPAVEGMTQTSSIDPNGRSFTREEGDFLERPGPATTSWGRSTDNIAALRRTRRRVPEMTIQTHKNPLYSGYSYSTPDAGSSGTTRTPPARNDHAEREVAVVNPLPDPLCWTDTLRSSFWQVVEAVTGSRSSDPEPCGRGSGFTPAPQRIASRCSPASATRLTAGIPYHTARSQETETNYAAPPENFVLTRENSQSLTHSGVDSFSTRPNELGVLRTREGTVGGVDLCFLGASAFVNDPSASTHQRHPGSLVVHSGTPYPTDAAEVRQYGYEDRIPSTWSALGARRESQLDLGRMSITSPNAGPLSVARPQLVLPSSLRPDSMSAPLPSDRDPAGSDNILLRSGNTGNTPKVSEDSVWRDGTTQSAGGCASDTDNASWQAMSTTSSMLSRKKGVVTRRKRASPPARAPSTASSIQSIESGLSIREVAAKRALLERRKKIKAAGSLKRREDREETEDGCAQSWRGH